MYSSHRLDTPPPSSNLAPRPWSPDPYDPLPSLRNQYPQHTAPEDLYYWDARRNTPQRREATDDSVSVEALDLADYANTLRPWRGGMQPGQSALEYPPSPPVTRAFSRDSFNNDVPSLSSSVPSAESSIPPYSSHGHEPRRRPFSLPPSSHYPSSRSAASARDPYIVQPSSPLNRVAEYPGAADSEIDIAQFPAFARNWYAKDGNSSRSPLSKDIPSAAFFDPTYQSNTLPSHLTNPYSVDTLTTLPPSTPWSGTDPYGVPLDMEMKEERMRMLEQEFGAKTVEQPEDSHSMVGSVDANGRLITQGPKKRIATRAVEFLMAVGIASASFYAALEIKPSSAPPPQGKPYTYVLYILSVVTILVMFYLFGIRPCCGGRRKTRAPQFTGPGGMMVLPVQSLPGGGKKKKKKGKKGQQGGEGVQVNLIVDPTMFGGRSRHEEEEEEEEGGHDEYSSSISHAGRSRASRRPRRRNILEGLAMEEQWRQARKELKWLMFGDTLFLLLWAVEFVWILIGERCPPGQYDGWCTAYNVSTALSCLLAVTYGLSIFFDIKDLHASKVSPRQRT